MYTIDKVTNTYAWIEPIKTEKPCQIKVSGTEAMTVNQPALFAKRPPIKVSKTSPA